MNRKVLVPNLPTRWDAAVKQRVPSIDLNTAAQYGELSCATVGPVTQEELPNQLHHVELAVQTLGEDDLILVIGDPVLYGAALFYAVQRNPMKKANVLRWDKQRRVYDMIEVKL